MKKTILVVLVVWAFHSGIAHAKPRARELGIPFEGTPGPLNAITDVKGVEVGHVTLISGVSKRGIVDGVARTGVTAVWPIKKNISPLAAGVFTENGNGEMTGYAVIEETGLLEGPVMMTNTQSVGVVRDATVEWFIKHFPVVEESFLPLVGEVDDSWLNDMYGFHVKKEHVFKALDSTKSGPVEEGNVGAGTGGHTCHFKAGIGTASRMVGGGYTVGVLVQSNWGHRTEMRIAGIRIGEVIKDLEIVENPMPPKPRRTDGSIVVVIATDAPFLPHSMKRIARRAGLGMARLGSIGRHASGEFFIAFSTAKPETGKKGIENWTALPLGKIDLFFEATVQAVEEAIVNAMVAAETMHGVNGNIIHAMPLDRVLPILKQHAVLKK